VSPLRPTPAALLAALGLTTALLLGGCSLLPSIPNPDAGQSDEANETPDSADDGADSDDADPDNADSDDGDGFAQTTMPANFPDEIPVADLDLVIALDLGTGWTIAYKTDDAVADFDALADQFTGEGWEQLSRETADGQGFASYDSPEFQVQLNAATENTGFDTPVLSMTVVRKD
jgi:hypothetical protein